MSGQLSNPGTRSVAIVDEGASFGGSLVVAAQLINNLDRSRYRAILVCDVDYNEVAHLLDADCVVTVKHAVSYVHLVKLRERLSGFSSAILSRVFSYLASTVAYVANWPYRRRLSKVLKNVDIVHSNNAREAIHIGAALGKPVLRHYHGPFPKSLSGIDRIELSRANHFVAVSQYIADTGENAGVAMENISVVANPCSLPDADLEKLAIRAAQQYSIPSGSLVLGIVGRIVEWKGQREFLDAAIEVLTDVPNAYAIIVGDAAEYGGNYENALKEAAENSDVSDRIVFTGFVADVSPIYALMDVLVHASLDPEPFGLVITEAMAHETAVIAADSGAPKEIVKDGVDGILVDPRDTRKLGHEINRLLADESLRESFIAAGLRKLRERYDPVEFANKISDRYDDLLKRS